MKDRIVIKLGGSSLQSPETLHALSLLVKGYQKRRYRVVVIHGGGPAINAELTKHNISWQFINGQRQTTTEMMSVIDDVLANQVNGSLVSKLNHEKIVAVGVSAADAKILHCVPASRELMLVGTVDVVDVQVIENLLNKFGAHVPVIAPIGIGKDGQKFNVNADWAAAKIAEGLGAKKLIFLTDQCGILDADKRLVTRATPQMIDRMIQDGVISGGMFTKVQAMTTALSSGIKQVRVLHASDAGSLLFGEKLGTLLTANIHSNKGMMHGRAS